MTLFEGLLVGHLVGDYLLQTRWMAEKKVSMWPPLLVHGAVYTAAVTLLALLAGRLLPLSAIALIFFSHIFLDNRFFVEFWTKKVTRAENTEWLKIMVDQTWHIVILALVTLI
ncbi:MAG: hypothetical protein STSR0004_22100 [Peptococcaceae bacterium]